MDIMLPQTQDVGAQTDNVSPGGDDAIQRYRDAGNESQISNVHATLIEPIARGKHDRLAGCRRIALSRVVSLCIVVTTVASCLMFQRAELSELALARMGVGLVGLVWFSSTFTHEFERDSRRACDGMSLLCFLSWGFSHVIWELSSTEADGDTDGDSLPAWVWMDMSMAWVLAPITGAGLELTLWCSIVPSWLCVTMAVIITLRIEEVSISGDSADAVGGLLAVVLTCALSLLAVGYQNLWEQARTAGQTVVLEDTLFGQEDRRRRAAFSELLLRHLITEPSLQVLGAGIKELFADETVFTLHGDALEQIRDGISTLAEYGEQTLMRLRKGIIDAPSLVLEPADMEKTLDICLRTTAFLAVSRDHHKVQVDMRVASNVTKTVLTHPLWLSQMTRACLIHALHPDEDSTVILRVSYVRPGMLRIGVETLWQVNRKQEAENENSIDYQGSYGPRGNPDSEESAGSGGYLKRRVIGGWDGDMPAAAWWVRAAALSLGGEADYDVSTDGSGTNELWFTLPANNIAAKEGEQRDDDNVKRVDKSEDPAPETSPGESYDMWAPSANTGATAGRGTPVASFNVDSSLLKEDPELTRTQQQPAATMHQMNDKLRPADLERGPGLQHAGHSRRRSQQRIGRSNRKPSVDPVAAAAAAASSRDLKRLSNSLLPLNRQSEIDAPVKRGASNSPGSGVAATGPPRAAPIHPVRSRKPSSMLGGLVQTFSPSNTLPWMSTPKQNPGAEATAAEKNGQGKLKILLVDPQGLLQWVLPRLREKEGRFDVSVALSAEEGVHMVLSGKYRVAVVDLHMPGMSGMEFCRHVRAQQGVGANRGSWLGGGAGKRGSLSGAGGALGAAGLSADSTKLLMHSTAAGTVKSDQLEGFLEEGLVEHFVPQPLDIATLFDFLKLFEGDEMEKGMKRADQDVLTDNERRLSSSLLIPEARNSMKPGRTALSPGRETTAAATGTATNGDRGDSTPTLWGRRGQPPPLSQNDMASKFFSVKGKNEEASGMRGGESSFNNRRERWEPNSPAGSGRGWQPGPPAGSSSNRYRVGGAEAGAEAGAKSSVPAMRELKAGGGSRRRTPLSPGHR